MDIYLIPDQWGCSNTTVKVQASEDLVAQFDYNTATGTITRKADGLNCNYVQANGICVEGGSRTLYLKILPGTYTNFNLLVKSNNNNNTFADKTKTSVTFAAGKVYDLGTYTCSE